MNWLLVGMFMMNKKGQTLIFFVILIPILLGFCALVVDTGLIVSENTRLKKVSVMALEELYDNFEENKYKELLVANNIAVDNLQITRQDTKINIKNHYEINSIFGQVLGIKEYEIKVDIVAYQNNDKLIIE